LAHQFDLQRDTDFTLIGRPDTTASLRVTHRSIGTLTYSSDAFSPADLWIGFAGVGAAVPSAYTAYVSGGMKWQMISQVAPSSQDNMMSISLSPVKEYQAGGTGSVAFGAQAATAGLDAAIGMSVTRFDDELLGAVPWFIDGQGNTEWYRDWDNYPDYANVKLTLTDETTGEQLYATDDADPGTWWGIDVPDLAPEAHVYRMDETTTSDTPEWTLSTKVESSWTWKSATTPQGADTLVNEPMRNMWYELPGLDAYNQGAASQSIVLHVGQQADSPTLPAGQVTLQATSDGGTTWSDVPVQKASTTPSGSIGSVAGETLYAGVITAPVGSTVSLRASVKGGDATLDQTITNAYPVTASPEDFPAGVAWQTGCQVGPTPTPTPTPKPPTPPGPIVPTGGTIVSTPQSVVTSFVRWLLGG